ncbi:hypothetical protein HYT23_06445 [Candidatus Pacearchaeota archaeon]|nr:hypothetical protein [Candidatus Pacearchaeota archaeon]
MKKILSTLALIGLFSVGCNQKSVQLCDGRKLNYDSLEVLAKGNEGQKLFKVDGKFYMGDSSCDIIGLGDNVISASYGIEEGRKILTVYYERDEVRHIWERDGSFHKEYLIK